MSIKCFELSPLTARRASVIRFVRFGPHSVALSDPKQVTSDWAVRLIRYLDSAVDDGTLRAAGDALVLSKLTTGNSSAVCDVMSVCVDKVEWLLAAGGAASIVAAVEKAFRIGARSARRPIWAAFSDIYKRGGA